MNFGETLFNPQQLFTDLNLVYMMTNVSILITYLKVLFIQISHFNILSMETPIYFRDTIRIDRTHPVHCSHVDSVQAFSMCLVQTNNILDQSRQKGLNPECRRIILNPPC